MTRRPERNITKPTYRNCFLYRRFTLNKPFSYRFAVAAHSGRPEHANRPDSMVYQLANQGGKQSKASTNFAGVHKKDPNSAIVCALTSAFGKSCTHPALRRRLPLLHPISARLKYPFHAAAKVIGDDSR